MRLILLTALTMMAFAGNSLLNRLAVGAGEIGALDFAAIRLVSGSAVLLVLVGLRWRRFGVPVWPGMRGRVAGSAALLTYLVGFSLAYGALDAGVGALILFGTVQMTMFAGAVVMHEAVPVRRWVGAALAFGGLVFLLAPGGSAVSVLHAAFMVAAGAGWGFYSLVGRVQADALGATAWNFALAVPVGVVLLLVLPEGGVIVTASGVGLAVVSGVVTSGLGYALWYRLLPELGTARAAVAQLTVPVIAAAGGAALLDEGVSLRFVLAAAVVLSGVALAVLPGRRTLPLRPGGLSPM